jgi:hypothetical protein
MVFIVRSYTYSPSVFYLSLDNSTFQLRDARPHIMTSHTKTLLGRLIRLTVQTGAFTSLLAIATLALFLNESKIGLFQTFP